MKKMPDAMDEDGEEVDLTNVNGAPDAMDEDGEEVAEDDNSPLIQKLVIGVYHPSKGADMQTDIQAVIHTEVGLQPKRIVIPGGVTAKRLGAILAGVASW